MNCEMSLSHVLWQMFQIIVVICSIKKQTHIKLRLTIVLLHLYVSNLYNCVDDAADKCKVRFCLKKSRNIDVITCIQKSCTCALLSGMAPALKRVNEGAYASRQSKGNDITGFIHKNPNFN